VSDLERVCDYLIVLVDVLACMYRSAYAGHTNRPILEAQR
jgi:hypothetical protein